MQTIVRIRNVNGVRTLDFIMPWNGVDIIKYHTEADLNNPGELKNQEEYKDELITRHSLINGMTIRFLDADNWDIPHERSCVIDNDYIRAWLANQSRKLVYSGYWGKE